MAFHVYPDPQIAPLNLGAGASSGLNSIDKLVGVGSGPFGLNTMFIRVVMLGSGCSASAAPDPGLRLSINGNPAVAVVIGSPDAVSLRTNPADPGTEVANAKVNFIGKPKADGVLVRSGPGETYYPTMKLDSAAELTIVGNMMEWLKIVPPAGSFCYVSKLYVERYGDGSTGRITHNDVNIRAGSSLNPLKLAVVAKLAKDQEVKVLAEEDEYLKIAPPANAYLYVQGKSVVPVRRIDEAVVRNDTTAKRGGGAEGA